MPECAHVEFASRHDSRSIVQAGASWPAFQKILSPKNMNCKRALGPVHLIALGIGAIIGAGIFVLTGHAAASYAGSGVVISFAIAGTGCLFAGLCYAEYAAMIPVAGSAYTYTYATMGRFLAWIIGWNLVLEYLAAGSTVAVGWSGYFGDFMAKQLSHAPRSPRAALRRRRHSMLRGPH